MRSGVLQGSVLGPPLSLVVVSYIDSQVMQNELDKIYDWADLNVIVFNNTMLKYLTCMYVCISTSI